MRHSSSNLYKPVLITLLGTLSACANNGGPPPTTEPGPAMVHICDDTGCNDRPKDYATFDIGKPGDEDVDGKVAKLEALAKKDPRAAYDLSLRYFRGDGVRQDSYKSIQWMRDAAERGNFNAQKALGRLYLTGLEEMGADYAEAHKWLSIAASRGDKEAAAVLDEVGEAKLSQQAQNRAYSRWHTTFYNAWQSGYPYLWYWRSGAWSLY